MAEPLPLHLYFNPAGKCQSVRLVVQHYLILFAYQTKDRNLFFSFNKFLWTIVPGRILDLLKVTASLPSKEIGASLRNETLRLLDIR